MKMEMTMMTTMTLGGRRLSGLYIVGNTFFFFWGGGGGRGVGPQYTVVIIRKPQNGIPYSGF